MVFVTGGSRPVEAIFTHVLRERLSAVVQSSFGSLSCTMAAFAGVVGLKTNVQRDITNPENIILFNFVKLILIIFFSFVL